MPLFVANDDVNFMDVKLPYIVEPCRTLNVTPFDPAAS